MLTHSSFSSIRYIMTLYKFYYTCTLWNVAWRWHICIHVYNVISWVISSICMAYPPGTTSWLSKDDLTLKCHSFNSQAELLAACITLFTFLPYNKWKTCIVATMSQPFKQADNMVVTRLSHPCCQDGCHLSVTTMLTNLLQPCNDLVTTCWQF